MLKKIKNNKNVVWKRSFKLALISILSSMYPNKKNKIAPIIKDKLSLKRKLIPLLIILM